MSSKKDRYALARYRIEDINMDIMTDVVSLIPNVKPYLAMREIHVALTNGTYGAADLGLHERSLIWRQDRGRKTSPIGGRILVNLFDGGKIPQTTHILQDISALRAYSAGDEAFRATVDEQVYAWGVAEARLEDIAIDPNRALPAEISVDLINQIFLRRLGRGKYGTMHIGGLECHKDRVDPRDLKSGTRNIKSRARCWWVNTDGVSVGQVILKENMQARR
tara:strand:- start:752 stop:1414 length:663 start_codon:yes stop_codon:yes gene_type:complete